MWIPKDLRLGDKGAEIGNWQRFLNEQQCFDWEENLLAADEQFGMRTVFATRRWQTKIGLDDTGIVRLEERIKAQEQGFIPFIQAKNCKILYPNPSKHIDLIVIHTMENEEKPYAAENVALWFAGLTKYPAPMASANYCVDHDSIIQCVRDSDIAYHAPGANSNGIGIEHSGRANQTDGQWHDIESLAILQQSAMLSAKLVKKHNLPIVKLTPDQVKSGAKGFCGHVDITLAFPGPGRSHTDPGKSFPYNEYLDMINNFM